MVRRGLPCHIYDTVYARSQPASPVLLQHRAGEADGRGHRMESRSREYQEGNVLNFQGIIDAWQQKWEDEEPNELGRGERLSVCVCE